MLSKLILKNPNRFSVPVMLKDGNGFKQVNIMPRKSIEITEDQISDSVANLTKPERKILTLTKVVVKEGK